MIPTVTKVESHITAGRLFMETNKIGFSANSISKAQSDAHQAKLIQNDAQGKPGQSDFSALLAQQLQYQAPLTPIDNSQAAAQNAQFPSMESLQNMDNTLKTISNRLDQLLSYYNK
jgi:flagellar basal-body rod modification protein FlgD